MRRKNARDVPSLRTVVKLPRGCVSGAPALDGRTCEVEVTNMAKFCVHEQHGGICEKTGGYCNLGACPYEDLREFVEVRHARWEFLGPNVLVRGCMCGTCSVCKVRCKYIVNTGLCPNCGAKMDLKEESHDTEEE